MSFWRNLIAGGGDEPEESSTDTVRRIVAELEALDPERARHLAAFAYILSRVAGADLDISEEETGRMREILGERGRLPEDQATLVVEIAKGQQRLFGGTEDFLVTREFAEVADAAQKRELLECLFAVAAADESISTVEEGRIRQIASELGFTLAEFVEARSAWSAHREVLKQLDG